MLRATGDYLAFRSRQEFANAVRAFCIENQLSFSEFARRALAAFKDSDSALRKLQDSAQRMAEAQKRIREIAAERDQARAELREVKGRESQLRKTLRDEFGDDQVADRLADLPLQKRDKVLRWWNAPNRDDFALRTLKPLADGYSLNLEKAALDDLRLLEHVFGSWSSAFAAFSRPRRGVA